MSSPARRIAAGAIPFLAAVHVWAGTPAQQPLLRAPWIGTAKISQGNNASVSHRDHGAWDNTYAIDLTKRDAAGKLIRFKVLAPADGEISFVKTTTSAGGRQIAVKVKGLDGQSFEVVFLHLSEIMPRFQTVGTAVKQGDVLAMTGGSGEGKENRWPIHMHFHVWKGVKSRDSHTMGMGQLRMRRTTDSSFKVYESKGDGFDDPLRHSLEDWNVASSQFESDNVERVPAADALKNGNFETIAAPTNAAGDGSWKRSSFTGSDFQVLRGGGTWGRNSSASYAWLGVADSSTQRLESAPFGVPGTGSVTLTFWLSIITREIGPAVFDTFKVSVVDGTSGAVLLGPSTWSNAQPTAPPDTANVPQSYVQRTIDLAPVRGKTVRLRFDVKNDVTLPTTFRLDDVSVTVR